MKTTMIWAVVIIIVLAGGWYLLSSGSSPSTSNNTALPSTPVAQTPVATTTATPTAPVATAPMTATVTYGANGFSPSSVTIAKGGTVTWQAQPGADELWVASNPHPTHEGYDGTTKSVHCASGYKGPAPFDQCATGTTFSFTFNTVGTWGYHNHGNHSDTGVVIVQ